MLEPGLVLYHLLWGLIGLAATPLIYRQKGRSPRSGLLPGLLAGGLGGLYLLIPLWLLVGRPRRICPSCRASVLADVGACPYCGHELPLRGNANDGLQCGYPELLPAVLVFVAAGALAVPLLYARRDPSAAVGVLVGALVGALVGLVGLELLWLYFPRPGWRCAGCGRVTPISAGACAHCGRRLIEVTDGTAVSRSVPGGASALLQRWGRLVGLPTAVHWGWLVAGALILGVLLTPAGLGVTALPGGSRLSGPTAPTLGPAPTPQPALGISRATAESRFKVHGYVFEPYLTEDGRTGILGKQPGEQAEVFIIGSQGAVESILLVMERPQGLSSTVLARQQSAVDSLLELVIADEAERESARQWIAAQEPAIWQTGQVEQQFGVWVVALWADPQPRRLGVSIASGARSGD